MAESSKRTGKPAGASIARRIALLVVLAGWAFILASLIGFNPADPPSHMVYPPNHPVANWCGPFGALVAYTLFKLMGFGAWVLLVISGLGVLSAAIGQTVRHAPLRAIGLVMLAASFSGLQHHLLPASGAFPDLAGGHLGTVMVGELLPRVGPVGTVFFIALMGIIGAIVAMDEWLTAAFGWTWHWTRTHGVPAAKVVGGATGELAVAAGSAAARTTARAGGSLFSTLIAKFKSLGRAAPARVNDIDDDLPAPAAAEAPAKGRKRRRGVQEAQSTSPVAPPTAAQLGVVDPDEEAAAVTVDEDEDDDLTAEEEAEEQEAMEAAKAAAEVESKPAKGKKQIPVVVVKEQVAAEETEEDEDDDLPGAPQVFDQEALKAKIAKLPIAFGQQNKQVATDASMRDLQTVDEGESYKFPGMDLLENPEENFSQTLEAHVREQATALESAMRQYNIAGEVVGIESGPVITLFDVRLAPGTKVAVVQAVATDIARALKSVNIRIVANQAGRDTIGIEVPNTTKEKVRLKELMGKTERFSSMKLPMFMGKDASGEPLIEDLAKMPHMLIAGTTGSGKSVCMNTIIMGFLYTRKPSELKMVLVDPKMVEMSQFKDIPHLMCPVVTEMAKAAAILEWACVKMDERYELLADAGCRDIASYNELTWDELKERLGAKTPEEEARIPRKLPYMVFIIDELADLMMTAKEVESHIIRIAQKARAVGMHLILATQRPQANVVTGLIKSNMPCRVAFRVASGMDSRIVLDSKGAELLLGYGDMLFLNPRTNKLSRSQGTLVDDREIRRVVKFMKEVASPSFERSLIQLRSGGGEEKSDQDRILQSQNNSSASLKAAQEDPMFNRAVEIVLETRRGSVSLLQRRLAIGYTRSSRLVDLMGIAGIISDHKGSVARDVLITPEEWAMMKQLAAEEAKAKGIVLPTEDALTPTEQSALFDAEEAKAKEQAPFDIDPDNLDGDDEEDDK
ncbi:MAG: DNA translocase FtsK [Phycisphaerales bacterium]